MSTETSTDLYTAGSTAYLRLKSLILLGEVPIGIRLREGRIAERLDVSRTPVREALLRLFAERFLERHSEGGFRVAAPSVQTLRQLYDLRRALELFALRRSLEAAAAGAPASGEAFAALEELRQEWMDIGSELPVRSDPEFVLVDEDFHYRLAAASGNEELCFELQRIAERIRPVRSHDFLTPGRITATIEEHVAIVDAILARASRRAETLLDEHISESQVVVEAAVLQALERMLDAGRRDSAW